MKQVIRFRSLCLTLLCIIVLIFSCSKGGGGGTIAPSNPCSGITITVTGTVVNPSAPAVSDGSIAASASGSSGLTFSINGGAFQSSASFTNLAAGSYSITAKNGNGCTGSASFTLTAPNPCAGVNIVVTGTITNPTASGATNGSIAASASGSTGFTFSINGGAFQSSGSFTSLGAGSYIITAKDVNGCTGSMTFTLTAPNQCTGVNITVSNSVSGNTLCQTLPTGSITATPAGGTGPYTFQLNSGAFQSSNIFSILVAGNYTITAKDANGCSGSNIAVVPNLPAGPLFSVVRTLLQNNCVSCHNSAQAEGGMDWTVDCNIVAFRDRIKIRAVDGNPSSMPPTGLLPASERQKITDWINAGGRFTD